MPDVHTCLDNPDKLRVFFPNHPSLEDRTLGIQDLWFMDAKPHKVWLKCAGKLGPTMLSRQYICMHHAAKDYYYFKDNSLNKSEFEDCPPCVYENDLNIQCADGYTLNTFDASNHMCSSNCGENQYWMETGCYCNHGFEWNDMRTDCVPDNDGDWCTGDWEVMVDDNCECATDYHWYMGTPGTHCVLDWGSGGGESM